MNDKGFVAAKKDSTGDETKNVDVLTFKGQEYTDFEVTYTFQQSEHRMGIILGTDKGKFPLEKTEEGWKAAGGVMFFLSVEGHRIARGDFLSEQKDENNAQW